jgi:hypothetical protein
VAKLSLAALCGALTVLPPPAAAAEAVGATCKPQCREDESVSWKKEVAAKIAGPAAATFAINSGPTSGPFRIYTWVEQRPMRVAPCDCQGALAVAVKHHGEELKELESLKRQVQALDDQEEQAQNSARRRDAELRAQWDTERAGLDDGLSKLDQKIVDLIKERNRVLDELRRGVYCSKCHRTASEIEAQDHVSFQQHLGDVKGDAVPAPDWVIAEKAKEYDDKLAALKRERDQLVKHGHERHDETERAIKDVWKQLQDRRNDLDDRIAKLEASARALAAQAKKELAAAEGEKARCDDANRVTQRDCTFKKAIRAWGVILENDAACPQEFDLHWYASARTLLGQGLGSSWRSEDNHVKCLVNGKSECSDTGGSCRCEYQAMLDSKYLVPEWFAIEIAPHAVWPGAFNDSPESCKRLLSRN